MAQIIIPCAANEAALLAAWASIPTDVVASGNSYWIQPDNANEIVLNSKLVLGGKTCGPNNGIKIGAAAGKSYVTNANFATNRLAYVPANGVAIRGTGEGTVLITQDWLEIDGIQFTSTYGYSHTVIEMNGCPNSVVRNPIIEAALPAFSTGISISSGSVFNHTVILRSSQGIATFVSNPNAVIENGTCVRTAQFAGTGEAFSYAADSNLIANCAIFGFAGIIANNSPNFNGKNNATDLASIPFGTGNKTSLVYADQFVNIADGTHDFRTKAGSALINAGFAPQASNTTAPGGNRQQGTSADIGSWEFIEAVQAPTATITSIVVSGTTVTISGTTTGGVTGGTASITPTSATGNNAVGQGPKAITLGSGTFTVQFTGGKVGMYSVALNVSNGSYSNVQAANNVGGFEIEGAKAVTVVQDPMTGQILKIHGTVNGAVSGNLIVPPAAVDPGGAAQQSVAVTITGASDPKNYTVSVTLTAGSSGKANYGAGILTFTNADGTSLPQAGTSAVTILGFDGNPEAPPVDNPPSNSAPTAPGTIPVIAGSAGVAITPVIAAAAFSDTDALSYSISPAGTAWPPGLGVHTSTGVISGTVAEVTVATGLRVRATDTAGQFVDSSPFAVAITAVSNPDNDPLFKPSVIRTIRAKAGVLKFDGGAFWNLAVPSTPVGVIDPDAIVDITMDWTEVLADIQDTIAGADVEATNADIVQAFTVGAKTTVFITAAKGNLVQIRFRIDTQSNPSRREDRTVYLKVGEQ